MTTMRFPVNFSPLDSDATVIEFEATGRATFNNAVVFTSGATFSRSPNFASLTTSLTTAQVSAWVDAITSTQNSDDGISPALVGFLPIQVLSSTMYVPVYGGCARFGLS